MHAISYYHPTFSPPRTYPTRTRRKEEEDEEEEEEEEGWGVSRTLTTRSWYCIPGTASVCKRRYDDKEDEAKEGIVMGCWVRNAAVVEMKEGEGCFSAIAYGQCRLTSVPCIPVLLLCLALLFACIQAKATAS